MITEKMMEPARNISYAKDKELTISLRVKLFWVYGLD